MSGAVLITGGARRIGREIALALAARGREIALHYNRSRDDAETAAEEIRRAGATCRLFQADLADMKQVLTLIERVADACPALDTLINNASIFEPATLLATDEAFYDRHFAVNLKAPFFLTRDFAHRIRRGHVINLLDTKVTRAFTTYFAYALTKKALFEFNRMAAKELAPRIRVNGVAPGLILPPAGCGDDYLEEQSRRLPLRAHGGPADIASAVLFLLDAPFITGECILVDGGEHLLSGDTR